MDTGGESVPLLSGQLQFHEVQDTISDDGSEPWRVRMVNVATGEEFMVPAKDLEIPAISDSHAPIASSLTEAEQIQRGAELEQSNEFIYWRRTHYAFFWHKLSPRSHYFKPPDYEPGVWLSESAIAERRRLVCRPHLVNRPDEIPSRWVFDNTSEEFKMTPRGQTFEFTRQVLLGAQPSEFERFCSSNSTPEEYVQIMKKLKGSHDYRKLVVRYKRLAWESLDFGLYRYFDEELDRISKP